MSRAIHKVEMQIAVARSFQLITQLLHQYRNPLTFIHI